VRTRRKNWARVRPRGGACLPLPTRNYFSHHPFTCTEGTEWTKSELGEHCLSSSPQERTRVGFPSSVDWISVNRPAPFGGDDAKRAFQGCLRDSLPPLIAIDEEARNPPVGRSLIQLAVSAHSARELDWGPELAPPNNIRTVIDEGRVGLIRSHKLLFQRPVFSSPLLLLAALELEGDAQSATPHTFMLLNNSRKVSPGLSSEFFDQKSSLGFSLPFCVRREVTFRVQAWGGQLFHKSDLPTLRSRLRIIMGVHPQSGQARF